MSICFQQHQKVCEITRTSFGLLSVSRRYMLWHHDGGYIIRLSRKLWPWMGNQKCRGFVQMDFNDAMILSSNIQVPYFQAPCKTEEVFCIVGTLLNMTFRNKFCQWNSFLIIVEDISKTRSVWRGGLTEISKWYVVYNCNMARVSIFCPLFSPALLNYGS